MMHEYSHVDVLALSEQQAKDKEISNSVLSIKKDVQGKSYSLLITDGKIPLHCFCHHSPSFYLRFIDEIDSFVG